MTKPLSPETLALHADDGLEPLPDVAPPIRLSTTFEAGNEEGLVYSRNEHPTRRRLERVLGALEGGHAVTYASGLAAAFAAMQHFRPKRVLVSAGYHGTHAVLERFRQDGLIVAGIDQDPREGDLLWIETPKNPTCEVEDIAEHARRAHKAGAHLAVDSTFATPILQLPLALGADLVMHASTKFLAGHSDVMGGVLAVPGEATAKALRDERAITGAVPGSLEVWLTLRSLRTLSLRVWRQSESASALAAWLVPRVRKVWHPSLRSHPGYTVAQRQMRGPGGVLSIELDDPAAAQSLPSRLRLFRDATSLGGVESLIEWRRKHDPSAPPALLRISVGLESPGDLIADLEQGLAAR
jgi:cystathionine gamma-synthase